ncbi:hypothetical protein BW13_10670 [Bifidobacterium sp. UTCIF-37]|nr:hypothetical protein BW13_10670 [Bifidobacterium sp. UTCIF-37]TPF88933.1 hypothetical protein BW11_06185 [Bifidobacterium sp. UTCIF-38]
MSIEAVLPVEAWTVPEHELLSGLDDMSQVINAGTLNIPSGSGDLVTVTASQWRTMITASVTIGSMRGLAARGAKVVHGMGLPYDEGIAEADVYTVLLGARLAEQLGIGAGQQEVTVEVNGTTVKVLGLVHDAPNQSVLSTTVFMSTQTARLFGLLPNQRMVHIAVYRGTQNEVERLLPYALSPAEPESVSVHGPSDPRQLRESLMKDSQTMTSVITAVMLVVTAFSIINTMQMSVNERRKEIGISLALGMPAAHVAMQFLAESSCLGLVGAGAGLLIGAQLVAAIDVVYGWRFILPVSVLLVPVLGMLTGAVSGLLPAAKATCVDPSELLRQT